MSKVQHFFQPNYLMAFVFFVLMGQNAKAQIITTSATNVTTWASRQEVGINYDPLPFVVVNSGVWTPPIQGATWPQECQTPPINTYPGGQPITTTGHLNCHNDGRYTSFFRTNVALPSTAPVCEAYVDVRADNFFRLWVNGVLVSNAFADDPAPLGGTCGGERVAIGVTGNGYQKIIRVNIASFISFNSLAQSIVFEVSNCDYLNYLSANVVIKQQVMPGPDPHINFTLNSDNILNLSGTPNGWSNQTWLLEQSSSPDGPWAFFATNSNNRPGASVSFTVPRCVFIRITHTVWYFCGTQKIEARAQHVLFTCGGFKSGENAGKIMDEIPVEMLQVMSEARANTDADYIRNSVAFFDSYERKIVLTFNESTGLETELDVMLTTVDGRVLRQIASQRIADNATLEIDANELNTGIYFITVNNNGNKKTHKVFVAN